MIQPYQNLEYSPEWPVEQQLDLYLPSDVRPEAPLLLFIHGGAWISGDKSEAKTIAEQISNEGIAVASANYRLSTRPEVKSPHHAQDVAKCYAWLVRNACRFGYSPKNIFVMGHSVGAHTAGMLATGTFLSDAGVLPPSMPKGFIGLEGIYDVPLLVQTWPTYREWFVDKAFTCESTWDKGSPTHRHVVIGAPWLVAHSAEDELVDMAQSTTFVKHLALEKVPAKLLDDLTGSHDEVISDFSSPLGEKILRFILDKKSRSAG